MIPTACNAHQRRASRLQAIVQRSHVVLIRAASQMPKMFAFIGQPFNFSGEIVHECGDEPVADATGHILDPLAGNVGKCARRKPVTASNGIDGLALRAAAANLFAPDPALCGICQIEADVGIINPGPSGTNSHETRLTLPVACLITC